MDRQELSEFIEEFEYILGRIRKYLKDNQYVYLRPFASWQDSYNTAAARLNADKTIKVPIFKLGPVDYSPTGKSIKMTGVDRLVKTLRHQISRLAEKIEEMHQAAERELAKRHPLDKFFLRQADGSLLQPQLRDDLVFVAIPPGEAAQLRFRDALVPALRGHDLTFFLAHLSRLDDALLAELCQTLYACRLAVFDLTDQSAGVMLILGMAFAIGKPVLIVQPQQEAAFGALNTCGFIRYTENEDLGRQFQSILGTCLRPTEER
ncbi:MAG: hypothetical protein GW875_13610 [Deltaproteobacteria bacterium]|nr:hypothetical protein [Deltaproteobacteria bacterium]NCP01909.1 hypothetical protein [Deltaproteobacteria bacterium]